MSSRRSLAFQQGEVVPAYDKRPRDGGQQIALLRIHQKPYLENSADIPANDWEAEGFAFMDEVGETICGREPRALWDEILAKGTDLYVVRFQVVDIATEARDELPATGPREPVTVR